MKFQKFDHKTIEFNCILWFLEVLYEVLLVLDFKLDFHLKSRGFIRSRGFIPRDAFIRIQNCSRDS